MTPLRAAVAARRCAPAIVELLLQAGAMASKLPADVLVALKVRDDAFSARWEVSPTCDLGVLLAPHPPSIYIQQRGE